MLRQTSLLGEQMESFLKCHGRSKSNPQSESKYSRMVVYSCSLR